MEAIATHLEALVHTALSTTGPILEIGCGDYSTPVLAAIAKAQDRKFTIYTNDIEWGAKYVEIASIRLVDDWGKWTAPAETFGMIFLDEQHSRKRNMLLPALAQIADAVVLHDAQAAIGNANWEESIAEYDSVTLFKRFVPWTAVLIPKAA